MVNFRISTLLAATASFAVLYLYVNLPHIAAGIMLLLLMIAIGYGLTAPAKGTELDISMRPGVQFVIRLWVISAVLIMLLAIACGISTDIRSAVDRSRFRQWQRTPSVTEPPGIVYGVDE
ncbi:hypothetical protein [Stieleria varia]|uniref:hypothetical protein n=1 Tax=Stieleria varia TaxID=2528005 RepID=UPI0011B3B9FD|nr:hypothetical protein [Stieleria varia]